MMFVRNAFLGLAVVSLLAVLPSAHAQNISNDAGAAPELFYLFQSEQLGYPAGAVSARFELRSDSVVLGVERVKLSFGDEKTVLVPLPSTFADFEKRADLRVLVFANGLLLDDFDRASLLAYNRMLGYTQPALQAEPLAKIFCQSPCGGGCGPFDDYDCDGVNNSNDNCTDDANSNQADCDNDGWGNVCDGTNGIFQATGSVDTCMTDKDSHVVYKTFEHHVEQRLTDVTSCNSPDRWNRWVRMDNDCFNISDYDCCYGLRTSLQAVGDTYQTWCAANKRNIDFCH